MTWTTGGDVTDSAYLSDFEQDNSKSYPWILMKPSGNAINGPRNRWLNFGLILTFDHLKILGQGFDHKALT